MMNITCKDKNIFVIQGDSLQKRYTFYDKDKNIITNSRLNSVLFSCKRLNYEQFLTYDDGVWVLTLTSEITSNFKQCKTSYDLTLYFESEQVSTQVYRAEFNVLKKDIIEDVEVSGEGENVELDDIDVKVDTNINIIISGSKNHDELEHRDYENQHPMSAITGLEDTLQELDNDKQDNINDLNFIRTGAEKGSTAVQPTQLSVYRTAALQDQIDELLVNAINDKQPLLTEYLKSASVSGNTLNLVNQDGTMIPFTPQGGGGEEYRTIFDYTVSEEDGVNNIVITQDQQGNPFSFKKVRAYVFGKASSKRYDFYVAPSFSGGSLLYLNLSNCFAGLLSSNDAFNIVDIQYKGNNVWEFFSGTYSKNKIYYDVPNTTTAQGFTGGTFYFAGGIDYLKLVINGGVFEKNCRIIVEGVDA